MKIYKILRYGLMKRIRRGVRISIALTFKCYLKCPYCVVDKPTGKTPQTKESTLSELIHFVKNQFPYRLREVKLTGGSPELHPEFVNFTNWLLSEGYFVQIYTNLVNPKILMKLKRTFRLMFIASYHHTKEWRSMSPEQYTKNYNIVKKHYRVVVEEIGTDKTDKLLPYSKFKNFIYEDDMIRNKAMIRVSPDLKIYCNCYDIYNVQARKT